MSLEDIEARRAARKAALESQCKEQRARDLEAIDALEIEHGDSNIAVLNVPFTPGLPTLVACRAPKPAEVKRYRARVKPDKQGHGGDPVAAAEEIAAVCRVYPELDVYTAVLEARPGVHVQLGVAAIGLAAGQAESEGKG